MESRSFTIIEERVGPYVRDLCKEIVLENIIEEAQQTMESIRTEEATNTYLQ
jgi:hypothetical protein